MNQYILKLIGGIFLLMNKYRYKILGYTSPRPFPTSEIAQAIKYDIQVVENWQKQLSMYIGKEFSFSDLSILELGPGPDLGIALYLLVHKINAYYAMDVNRLIDFSSGKFYDEFLTDLEKRGKITGSLSKSLRIEVDKANNGDPGRINYECNQDFDLSFFSEKSIDLVVSQAAFEHFTNVDNVIIQVSKLVKSGGLLIAEIDLKTHTRWIRDLDPLNIYRFNKSFYDGCNYVGIPNRVRPKQYRTFFENNGWTNISISPLSVVDSDYLLTTKNSLANEFKIEGESLKFASLVICARKM